MTTEELIEKWIKEQHGTAGWEQKLVNLVQNFTEAAREETLIEAEEALSGALQIASVKADNPQTQFIADAMGNAMNQQIKRTLKDLSLKKKS